MSMGPGHGDVVRQDTLGHHAQRQRGQAKDGGKGRSRIRRRREESRQSQGGNDDSNDLERCAADKCLAHDRSLRLSAMQMNDAGK
jgi:hypothetical protein